MYIHKERDRYKDKDWEIDGASVFVRREDEDSRVQNWTYAEIGKYNNDEGKAISYRGSRYCIMNSPSISGKIILQMPTNVSRTDL